MIVRRCTLLISDTGSQNKNPYILFLIQKQIKYPRTKNISPLAFVVKLRKRGSLKCPIFGL